MKKRPNMEVVGGKIARLRREKELCIVTFAREIEQPVWLLMLLENAHDAQCRHLIDLLPDGLIENLLREVREVYGVSERWLTTRYQSSKQPPLPEPELPAAPLLYLPISLSAADFISLLDGFINLALPADPLEVNSVCRQLTNDVVALYHLQQALLREAGCSALAQEQQQKLQALFQQRLAALTPA